MGLGLNATDKLAHRLRLRDFFDAMDHDRDGKVSAGELALALAEDPNVRAFFDVTVLEL